MLSLDEHTKLSFTREQFAFNNSRNKKTKILEEDIKYIAGIDVQYDEEIGICAFQIFDYNTGEIIHEDTFTDKIEFPYHPGLLYYRESNFLGKAFNKIKEVQKVDLIALDGNGNLHPRMMGEASQFGMVYDIPTIGIAKRCMKFNTLIEKKDELYVNDILVGKKVYLNPDSKTPMYVSSGHKTDVELAEKVVLHMQKFSPKTKYSYLTKGSDHLARQKQKEIFGYI